VGRIAHELVSHHLNRFPKERDLLVPFLTNFDVTWAQRHTAKNTSFSAYFLRPEQTIVDQFGIDAEVLLVISDFRDLQPRTMQAIDEFLSRAPALGRVDQTTFFVVSPDPQLANWIASYVALNPQSRVTIAISEAELRAAKDSWFIRSALSRQLYSRDLFADQLPLRTDTFFFGRDKVAAELAASAKLCQNRGLFGLRKTGKTSLLFKVQRMLKQEGIQSLYYDCKDPAIRSQTWSEFLAKIISDVKAKPGMKVSGKEEHISSRFKSWLGQYAAEDKIVIIFDEIEFISPLAKLDEHWKHDFVPFWQTLWTTQSEHRNVSYVIAGVNPTVSEIATVDGVQNPVFGIVTPKFLTGLDEPDVRQMLGKFGKRMGLRFDHDAALYMYRRYGGHPLLTRMAGSYVNSEMQSRNVTRPVTVTRDYLAKTAPDREQELLYYCPHVVSELVEFYPDEYEMLEWLATGNEADFYEFAEAGSAVRHLKSYGLIDPTVGALPKIEIPILERYVLSERKKRDRTSKDIYIVPAASRENWLRNRLNRVGADLRRLEKVGSRKGKLKLYGDNGFPEAERFFGLPVVQDNQSFQTFVNVCNRCFVEPIEQVGRTLNKRNYFWDDLKADYPDLWYALLRVKLYRHEAMHLDLTDRTRELLASLKAEDFKGKPEASLPEKDFFLQQKVLDGLFTSTMLELDRLV
jgi:hypothetical protein